MKRKIMSNLAIYGLAAASTVSSLGSARSLPNDYVAPVSAISHEIPSVKDEMLIMRKLDLEKKRDKIAARKLHDSKIESLSHNNYRTNNFRKDDDYVLLGRMIFGECSGCSEYEKIAVAWTAINRANDGVKWNGETLKDAILSSKQYSTFNYGRDARIKNPMKYDSRNFLEDLLLSQEILDGKYPDPTNGATHYFNRHSHDLNGAAPYWAKSLEKVLLENVVHEFFKPRKS